MRENAAVIAFFWRLREKHLFLSLLGMWEILLPCIWDPLFYPFRRRFQKIVLLRGSLGCGQFIWRRREGGAGRVYMHETQVGSRIEEIFLPLCDLAA